METPIIELKYYRKVKKISQKDLAKKLEITQGYISKIENGVESPTIRMVYKFANALEICPRLLLPCIIEYKQKNNCECELEYNEGSYI